MNSLKWKERKGGKDGEREREGGVRERDEESMRERGRWGSEWVRERGRLLKREKEREREREREREKEREREGEGERGGSERER